MIPTSLLPVPGSDEHGTLVPYGSDVPYRTGESVTFLSSGLTTVFRLAVVFVTCDAAFVTTPESWGGL